MKNTFKNIKWIIFSSILCIATGILTFFTFINQSFIKLSNFNLQILLVFNIVLLITFFGLIFIQLYRVFKDRKKGKIGSQTSLRYIVFFSTTTLLPSILIALFSLFLLNVVLQKYFEKKIKSVVNNSREIAQNYVSQTRKSIESDLLLMIIDVNNRSALFYNNPKMFQNLLATQRILRRLDEVHLLDGAGNIIISDLINPNLNFISPPEEAFVRALDGKPLRIIDTDANRTSALIKLSNFIDTYLYIVRFMDPNVINYLKQTGEAITFYYNVQDRKTGIKISFAIVYVLIVSLLLFLSVNIAISFASRLTRPIVNLIGASEKISSGDLNSKVEEIETDEEFKKLNQNFNKMIEKLKKQQDKLLLSERHLAWESVARKLAHEIKNPLTPIQLSIDRIREKYSNQIVKDKDNFSIYLNTINKQIKDIEYLVNEFSDFARMPKPILKKINFPEVIREVINLNKLSDATIHFDISQYKPNISVKADREQLNRVFLNLIKNSIESIYVKKNKNIDFQGKITIDINDDNDYIYVDVVDNGIGFDHVNKDKMLTPYYTTKEKGTGLGLAVVAKIINDHNGLLLFNSIIDGAKVSITVPKI